MVGWIEVSRAELGEDNFGAGQPAVVVVAEERIIHVIEGCLPVVVRGGGRAAMAVSPPCGFCLERIADVFGASVPKGGGSLW